MHGFKYVNGQWHIEVPVGTNQPYWIDWFRRRILQSSDQIVQNNWELDGGVLGDTYIVGLKTGASISTPVAGSYTIRNTVTTSAPVQTQVREFIIDVV